MGEGPDDTERRALQELGEIIDDESTEIVVRPDPPPATLFRSDDPVEIIERASAVASALSEVLKQRGLTTKIGQKDHVQVEGWTLCGAMLGVFPVVEWTRKLENGWEARVEARTKDGAVVGAAEAECLNTETRWKSADDYAIRSMAQTRAISKALRAPLGFVVHLAGFAATPLEEMVADEPSAPRPFNPETDLLPGAIVGEDANRRLFEALNGFDPTVDWQFVLANLVEDRYDKPSAKELAGKDYADFLRRLSNTVQWLTEHTPAGDFPPVPAETLTEAFAFAFGGIVLEMTYKEPPEPEETVNEPSDAALTPEQQAKVDEALGKDDIEFGAPE